MNKTCTPTRTGRASSALRASRRVPPSRRRLLVALLLPALCSAALLSSAARATETAQLRVVGRIVPAPCSITIGNNGSADFGNIMATELPGDGMRKLTGERSLSFAIQCVPANSPRLSFRDDRSNSIPAIYERISTAAGRARMFGLGRVEDKSIGMYLIHFSGLKADGRDAKLVRAVDAESPWQFIDQGEVITKEYKYAWSTTAQPQTGSFGALNGDLVVKLWPEPLDQLPLQSEIRLDGSATLVLEYP